VSRKIPLPVIAVVADALGSRYSHARIDSFMMTAGIELAQSPSGNREVKTRAWLRCANERLDDPLAALGIAITEMMEVTPGFEWEEKPDPNIPKVHAILRKYHLAYLTGGQIVSIGTTVVSATLQAIIRSRDLSGMQAEFERINQNLEADPPAAVTASCALLEAAFKAYIEQEKLRMPSDQTLKPLWKTIRKDLKFDPDLHEDDDLKTIVGGLAAIVEGTGSLRTHKGSAHGRSKKTYKLKPRHARLATHASFVLASFVLEAWTDRKARIEEDAKAMEGL
jgi:hypothetical protein